MSDRFPKPMKEDQDEPTCRFCGADTLRRSRLRAPDLLSLLLLRAPVRCLGCGKRQTLFLWQLGSARPSNSPHLQASPETGWLHESGQHVVAPQAIARKSPDQHKG